MTRKPDDATVFDQQILAAVNALRGVDDVPVLD
jgi:hypothetical protein